MLGPEMVDFNVLDGYPEALVRALRKGFLKEETYMALRNCANVAEFKLVLEDTDYSFYITPEPMPMASQTLNNICKQKLAKELQHIIAQSSQPLTGFLQRMLHGY